MSKSGFRRQNILVLFLAKTYFPELLDMPDMKLVQIGPVFVEITLFCRVIETLWCESGWPLLMKYCVPSARRASKQRETQITPINNEKPHLSKEVGKGGDLYEQEVAVNYPSAKSKILNFYIWRGGGANTSFKTRSIKNDNT